MWYGESSRGVSFSTFHPLLNISILIFLQDVEVSYKENLFATHE